MALLPCIPLEGCSGVHSTTTNTTHVHMQRICCDAIYRGLIACAHVWGTNSGGRTGHTNIIHVTCHVQVRRHAAEQLYLALLALSPCETGGAEGGITPDAADAVQEVVLGTAWDGDMEGVKAARTTLAGHLQVKHGPDTHVSAVRAVAAPCCL